MFHQLLENDSVFVKVGKNDVILFDKDFNEIGMVFVSVIFSSSLDRVLFFLLFVFVFFFLLIISLDKVDFGALTVVECLHSSSNGSCCIVLNNERVRRYNIQQTKMTFVKEVKLSEYLETACIFEKSEVMLFASYYSCSVFVVLVVLYS